MKRSAAYILVGALLLSGCTAGNSGGGNSVISTSVDLDNLQMNTVTGVVGSALRHTGDLTSLKTSEQVDYFVCAPIVYSDGEMIYLIRNFPEELTTPTEYNDFAFGDNKYCFYEIEVYSDDDLTAPVKTIELTELKNEEVNIFWRTILYDSEDDLFYLTCRRDSETVLYTADGSGKLVSEKTFSFDTLHEHFVYDGAMYVHAVNGYSGDEAALTVEDIETRERKLIADNARLAFPGEDGVYYFAQILTEDYEYEYHMFRYDHTSGESESVMEVDTNYFTLGKTAQYAAYDCSEKALYLASNYEIIVLKDGHELSVLSTSDVMLKILQLTGDHLLLGIGINQVSLYEPSDDLDSLADQQVSIRVCCLGAGGSEMFFSTSFDNVISKMNAAGLFVNFEYVYTARGSEYENTMAKKLLAGDTDFDIFYIESNMHGLLDVDYYEDLSSYDMIRSAFDHALPGVEGLCTVDGKLALVPRTLMFPGIVNSQTDSAPAESYTYREFIDGAREISGGYWFGGSDAASMLMPWFNELHSNYMADRISDKTAEKDLAMLYCDMLAAGDSKAFGTGENYSESKLLFRYRTIGSRSSVMPLPPLGDDYGYSADGMFLAVNPNSSNKDIAVAFIAYYLEMCLNSELGQPDEYFDTFDKAADSPITAMLQNSVRRTSDSDWNTHVSDMYKKLLTGSIPAEEAASQSVRYLRMVRDE